MPKTAVFGALFSSCSVFAALRLMHGECRRYFIIEEHAELLRHGAKKYRIHAATAKSVIIQYTNDVGIWAKCTAVSDFNTERLL